ncbi:uncharacterized protein LOC119269064 [Triticum dicoccoides]|uniref:uncharacterized protein LOC119269064 n=1 Tax=Triticum dicoccoides TaxID=85692 RepID=UPI00188F2622|nr:uncharacterized protein LOC119269064 [Triticum dicoccoides]
MAMAMATAEGDSIEFPVDRFPLPDLAGGDPFVTAGITKILVCAAAESSIGDAGEAAVTVQLYLHSTCDGVALSAPTSQQSSHKDGPTSPRWTRRESQRRVTYGHTDADALQ